MIIFNQFKNLVIISLTISKFFAGMSQLVPIIGRPLCDNF